MRRGIQNLLWFGAGFAVGTVLSISYQAVRYVPMAVAFGLLCFGCGLLLFLYLDLRRRNDSLEESWARALEAGKEFQELRKAFETEKQDWEDEKAAWEAEHSDEPETGASP